MTANFSPVFTLTPNVGVGQISAANAARDGSGTIVDVLIAGANGTKIFGLTIQSTVTTTAGMVRMFLYNGATNFLFREYPVTAITGSASVAEFTVSDSFSNLEIATGWKLRASTHNAEAFNVVAVGGDF